MDSTIVDPTEVLQVLSTRLAQKEVEIAMQAVAIQRLRAELAAAKEE